jgi:collagenase-like PrtC family protease
MMKDLTDLRREEIPQEVLDDISKHFSTVIWDNYGKDLPEMDEETTKRLNISGEQKISLDVKTRVSNYRTAIDENAEGFDEEFHPVRGKLMKRYYIRGVLLENKNLLDIYLVWSMAVFVSTKENEICPKFRN